MNIGPWPYEVLNLMHKKDIYTVVSDTVACAFIEVYIPMWSYFQEGGYIFPKVYPMPCKTWKSPNFSLVLELA